MTAKEVRDFLYNLDKMPEKMEVDHETYANVFQSIINHYIATGNYDNYGNIRLVDLSIGSNNGIYFKGTEIILVGKPNDQEKAHTSVSKGEVS